MLTALVAAVGVLLGLVHALAVKPGLMDESLPLVAAERVLAGELPYRDYFTLYPPLTTYLEAALFLVAPHSFLAARLLFLAIAGVGFAVLTRLAMALAQDVRKGAIVGFIAALGQGPPLFGYALDLAAVIVLAAFLAALRARDGKRRWLVVTGALLGLASLARHDVATWAALPILGSILAFERHRGGTRSAFAAVGIVVGVASVPPLAFVAFMVSRHAGGEMWDQLVRFSRLYSKARRLPFPLPWEYGSFCWFYGPLVVGVLAGIETICRRRLEDARTTIDGLAAAVFPLVLAGSAFVRCDSEHMYAARLASFLGLAVLVRRDLSARKPPALTLALILVLVTAGVELRSAADELAELRAGVVFDRWQSPELRDALALVATRPPGSRIYVGLRRHQRFYVNDARFYFLARAIPAARYHELVPLVASEPEVQAEIARDIERWRAPFVVLVDLSSDDDPEPNASATVFPVTTLDDYIDRAYEPALETENYRVLRRRPGR